MVQTTDSGVGCFSKKTRYVARRVQNLFGRASSTCEDLAGTKNVCLGMLWSATTIDFTRVDQCYLQYKIKEMFGVHTWHKMQCILASSYVVLCE